MDIFIVVINIFFFLSFQDKSLKKNENKNDVWPSNKEFIMPPFVNRLAFMKMRRLLEIIVLSLCFIIILSIGSKWSSSNIPPPPMPSLTTPTTTLRDTDKDLNIKVNNTAANSFLPQDKLLDQHNQNLFIDKRISSQSNLEKYIHLDLKGAPPQANKFYEGFFNFIENIQMGVKGIVIEYEDMLPLNGKLANVNI